MKDMKILIKEADIKDRIKSLANDIKKHYKNEPIHMICVLKGAVFFFCDLAKELSDIPITIDFLSVESYGDGTVSSGIVKIKKDLDNSIEGKNVLLVEDIIDTGHTLEYLRSLLLGRLPKSLAICTLLDKPSRREVEVPVEFCGFKIEDKFVIGYGLDWKQNERAKKDIMFIE